MKKTLDVGVKADYDEIYRDFEKPFYELLIGDELSLEGFRSVLSLRGFAEKFADVLNGPRFQRGRYIHTSDEQELTYQVRRVA